MSASRIFIAVSSPWASEKLVDTVRDMAIRLGASVVVAHVAQATSEDESKDDVTQRAKQTLDALAQSLTQAGIDAEPMLLFGEDKALAIMSAAKAQQATMLIVGATAKGRWSRIFEGDVPRRILRQADIPVLMLPLDWSGSI